MANIFDRTNYPKQEPNELVVGDRWVWQRPDLVSDYAIADFALSYTFTDDAGAATFAISATEADNNYFIEVASSTTASLTAGEYQWKAFVKRSSDNERFTVDEGRTKILANTELAASDVRSHAKKVLDAIEAIIENRASQDQMSYSIAGRSLSRMTIQDLHFFRARYKAEYNEELKKARIKNEQNTGNTIKVRF